MESWQKKNLLLIYIYDRYKQFTTNTCMDEIFQRWVLQYNILHQFRVSYDFMAAERECFVHEILMSFVLSGIFLTSL